MARKTLYCILDTETTMKNGMVFDVAWDIIDRFGNSYDKQSFVITDVLAIEEPFYKDKIAQYWTLVFKRKAKPLKLRAIRRIFNDTIKRLIAKGYKVVICAYNASFDVSHLGLTSNNLLNGLPFLTFKDANLKFLDLWHAWVMGCPVDFGYFAPWTNGEKAGTKNPKTGKPYPFNIKTSAETVYRYISGIHDFEEKHMAHSDIIIEKVILLDTLRRKKKLPIVSHPKEFVAMPWKIAQQRCRKPIEERKKQQSSFLEIIENVPEITEPKAIVFNDIIGDKG